MIAWWWKRSETCSRRNQTCRMLIRTSLDQLSLLIRVAEEEAEEGGTGGGGGGDILKPFLFRSSIILAVLYLAASSINCFRIVSFGVLFCPIILVYCVQSKHGSL